MSPRSNPPPDSRPMQADVPRADVTGMSGQIISLGMDPALVCSATHLTLPLRLSLSLSIYLYFYLYRSLSLSLSLSHTHPPALPPSLPPSLSLSCMLLSLLSSRPPSPFCTWLL